MNRNNIKKDFRFYYLKLRKINIKFQYYDRKNEN